MINDLNIEKICGVVVLYEPDDRIISHIDSYLGSMHLLIIFDNSRSEHPTIKEYFSTKKNVNYIFNGDNIGIAAALNIGGELGLTGGCNWLLSMDQDSYFDSVQIRNYITWVTSESPNDMAVAGISFENNIRDSNSGKIKVKSVNKVITSGSMINLLYWKALKGFDEKLFIDEVDHEYCYRAICNGYQVNKLLNVSMYHEMGRSIVTGYFGRIAKKPRMIHSPLRIYYMVRNYLYTRNKYLSDLPEEFVVRDRELKVILKNNFLFSGKFSATLKMATRGYLDYRNGVFGKYT